MDILVPDIWLRDYLKAKATPRQLGEYLSLCGPSVEKIEGTQKDTVYSIEVTTNRVDSASVYGIAREANAILPEFKISSKLTSAVEVDKSKLKKTVSYLNASVDPKLCYRFTAVLIKNIKVGTSPNWIKERLSLVRERPINNVVDVSNYIMHEWGQPVHTFDYDKIKGKKMKLRESKKGELITTLDGKKHKLLGGDIVIEDGGGRLIDLAGIMGGQNSAVDKKTKNVLLFVQTYNPINIRKTSMGIAHRTKAAVLFEKDLDPELVSIGIKRGIDLFQKLKVGTPTAQILDIYPFPYKGKSIEVSLELIKSRLGVEITNREIGRILTSLGFQTSINKNTISVQIPSFRAKDINIPEDIVEEVARIYGYHNLPSGLMTGQIPDPLHDAPFDFENKIKNLLSGWGGVEVYTQSLVSQKLVETDSALRLKNPLGKDGEYLRNSLTPSLIEAANSNKHFKENFHLFEIANVYIPKKGDLPIEKMTLAGILANNSYRESKGLVEGLLVKLGVPVKFTQNEEKLFLPSQHLNITVGKSPVGQFGTLESGYHYYELDLEKLRKLTKTISTYKLIPKYPAQIEDITFKLPQKTKVGEVISLISTFKLVSNVELRDIYNDSFTFRIWYQDLSKTLTDNEVNLIRSKLVSQVQYKLGGIVKN